MSNFLLSQRAVMTAAGATLTGWNDNDIDKVTRNWSEPPEDSHVQISCLASSLATGIYNTVYSYFSSKITTITLIQIEPLSNSGIHRNKRIYYTTKQFSKPGDKGNIINIAETSLPFTDWLQTNKQNELPNKLSLHPLSITLETAGRLCIAIGSPKEDCTEEWKRIR